MTVLMAVLYAGAIFLVLDGLWLGVIARDFFVSQLGPLMREKLNIVPAALFYVIYTGALVWFCVLPAHASGGWTQAALSGAILGLAAYGAYDLTNLATLKGYPVAMTVVDIVWGTVLSAATAAGAVLLLKLYP